MKKIKVTAYIPAITRDPDLLPNISTMNPMKKAPRTSPNPNTDIAKEVWKS